MNDGWTTLKREDLLTENYLHWDNQTLPLFVAQQQAICSMLTEDKSEEISENLLSTLLTKNFWNFVMPQLILLS